MGQLPSRSQYTKKANMGYYFRYLTQTSKAITLKTIEKALRTSNQEYHLRYDQIDQYAEILYHQQTIANIEINVQEDEIFEDDINELIDTIGTPHNTIEQQALQQIHSANTLIAVEAIWEGTERDPTLDKLDPLWKWLFQHHSGILQADGEGFYDSTGLIIPRNFTL